MYYPVWELKEKNPHTKRRFLKSAAVHIQLGTESRTAQSRAKRSCRNRETHHYFFLSFHHKSADTAGRCEFPQGMKIYLSIHPSIHSTDCSHSMEQQQNPFFSEDLTLNWVCLCLEQSMSMVKNQCNLHIHHWFLARRFTYTKINARQNFFSHIHQSSTIVVPIPFSLGIPRAKSAGASGSRVINVTEPIMWCSICAVH